MAPVHFGDLAALGYPGVRLRVGEGPVRLCCGASGPFAAAVLDWFPDLGVYVDQVTGSPVVNVGAAPTIGVGLGGLAFTRAGVLADPFPSPGITGAGCSAYFLVAKHAGPPTDDSGASSVGGVKRHPGPFTGDSVALRPSGSGPGTRNLGFLVWKEALPGGAGSGPGSLAIPEGSPTPVKSVLSLHWQPAGGDSLITVRVNGAVSFGPFNVPSSAPLPGTDHMLIGGESNGGSPFVTSVSFEYYRAQYYQSSVYDPLVKDALLALLP
jgi:hypothetical protein